MTERRRIMQSLLLTILLALGVTAPAWAGDLAQNRPASASSTERDLAQYAPARANDGNSATRWSSAFADNQWWEVDLGSDQTIDRVELNWEVAYASRYQIQTRRSQSESWSTAATVSISSPGLKVHTFAARKARYVRLSGDARATSWGISLWDARVCDDDTCGAPAPTPTPTPTPDWTFCSNEFVRCSFSGTKQVRYGANTTWTTPREFTNGVDCSNNVFGDPLPYVTKRCETRDVPTSTPTPTPTPTPTERFSVDAQGRIIDPDGEVFVPVGINASGQNWVWSDPMLGYSDVMATWHFNTIRLNNLIRCWSGQPCNHQNDNLDAIINEYTAKKIVVMLTNHTYGSTTGAYLDSTAEADDLINWWRGLAQRHKGNPYVWFNMANEPTSHTGAAGLATWEAMSTRVADAIGAEAPNSMLVFDGHSAGQDKTTWSATQCSGSGWQQGSAALQKGQAMQNRYGRNRVIMSAHGYNQWAGGTSGTNPRNCSGPLNDPLLYWRQDMNTYLDQLQAKGVPMVWGEFGARNLAQEEGWFIGSNDASYLLTEQVAPSQDVKPGALYWHGSCGDARCLFSSWGPNWADFTGDTSGLSRNGRALYDYARAVR